MTESISFVELELDKVLKSPPRSLSALIVEVCVPVEVDFEEDK
nr:hypothetical protein [Propionicimonas sp.]